MKNEEQDQRQMAYYDLVRDNFFSLGLCDARNGFSRTEEDLIILINRIFKNHGWSYDREKYANILFHHKKGKQYIQERVDLFEAGFLFENPENDLLYHYFVEGAADPVILEEVMKYPDFELEMKIYRQEMEEQQKSLKM